MFFGLVCRLRSEDRSGLSIAAEYLSRVNVVPKEVFWYGKHIVSLTDKRVHVIIVGEKYTLIDILKDIESIENPPVGSEKARLIEHATLIGINTSPI